MKRRKFLKMLGFGVAAGSVAASVPIEAPKTYWAGTTIPRNAVTREEVMCNMLQVMNSPETMKALNDAGYRVDVEELFHMVHDMSGWKKYYDIVK